MCHRSPYRAAALTADLSEWAHHASQRQDIRVRGAFTSRPDNALQLFAALVCQVQVVLATSLPRAEECRVEPSIGQQISNHSTGQMRPQGPNLRLCLGLGLGPLFGLGFANGDHAATQAALLSPLKLHIGRPTCRL